MKFYYHIISLSKAASKGSKKWTAQAFYVRIDCSVYVDVRMVWKNITLGLMCLVTKSKNCFLALGSSFLDKTLSLIHI